MKPVIEKAVEIADAKLVDNWRQWPKMASQWCNAAGVAGVTAYALLPEKLQDALPPDVALYAALALFALGFVGRLVKQESVSGK